MKCVVIGEAGIAVHVVSKLLSEGHELLGVVAGSNAFAEHMREQHPDIPALGPEERGWVEWVLGLGDCDLFISALNLRRIPDVLIAHARVAAINFHDALLPRHAGLFAPQMAIACGDEAVGVTWHRLEPAWDTGDVLVQKSWKLPPQVTVEEAQIQLLQLGRLTFDELLPRLADGTAQGHPQDLDQRTYIRATTRPGDALLVQPHHSGETLERWARSTKPDGQNGAGVWGQMRVHIDGNWFDVLAMEPQGADRTPPARFASLVHSTDGRPAPPSDSTAISSLTSAERAAYRNWMEVGYRCEFAIYRMHERFGAPPQPNRGEPVPAFNRSVTWNEAMICMLIMASREGATSMHVFVERPDAKTHLPAFPEASQLVRREFPMAWGWSMDDTLESVLTDLDRHWRTWAERPDLPPRVWPKPGSSAEAWPWVLRPSACGEGWDLLSQVSCPAGLDGVLNRWRDSGSLRLHALSVLTDAESKQLDAWECGVLTEEPEDFVRAFWRQVAERPEAPAVELADGTVWRYVDLADRVGGQSQAWQAEGRDLSPGTVVMVALPLGPDVLVTQLTALTLGLVVASVHEAESEARLDEMIRASEARWGVRHRREGRNGFWVEPGGLNSSRVWPEVVEGTGLACILFTSGTTGPPKAVEVTRRGLSNHLAFISVHSRYAPDTRLIVSATPAFDGILEEFYGTLGFGATVVFPREMALQSIQHFGLELIERRISILCCNTLLWTEWMRSPAFELPPTLRTVNVGGDRLEPAIVAQWHERCTGKQQDVRFLNGYGPTEASVTCTSHVIGPDSLRPAGIPIGRPEWNVRIRLVDENHRRVLPGARGQILIGGCGLAAGYRNNPEQTRAKFLEIDGERWYASGDIGFWDPDGELMFQGRMDSQVKYRSYRLEIMEVESALMKLPQVSMATAHFVKGQNGDLDQLVACILPQDNTDAASIPREVERLLPRFLRPSAFVMLDKLPKTSSGKPDKKALEQLARARLQTSTAEANEAATDEEIIFSEVARVLGTTSEHLDLTRSFRDNGGDSLAAMVAQAALEKRFHRQLPIGGLHGDRLLADLPNFLAADASLSFSVISRPEGPAATTGPWLVTVHNIFGYPTLDHLWPQFEAELPICVMRFGAKQKAWLAANPQADLSAYAATFVADLAAVTGGAPVMLTGSSFGGWLAWHLAIAYQDQTHSPATVILTEPMPAGHAQCFDRAASFQHILATDQHIARRPRAFKYLRMLRNAQLRLMRLPDRIRFGKKAVRPLQHKDPLPWDNKHPNHKLLTPLLERQSLSPAPVDTLIFVRVGYKNAFRFWRQLVPFGAARLSIVALPEREHHGFIFAKHAEHMAIFIRRFFGLKS